MEPTTRFWEIFFELYEGLPRQGPGNRSCAVKALQLCRNLPSKPAVLDLGCGVGGQTLYLAEMLQDADITAMDSHEPSIKKMRDTVTAHGLTGRIKPVVGDMANPVFPPKSFDLVWSEGALYNVGIEKALRLYHGTLRSGGYIAFTEAVWRKENPPPEVKASFDLDYPAMGRVPDVIAAIARTGFSLVDHFTLTDEAWWDDFYTPMEQRIAELRSKYSIDAEALEVLGQLAQEPEMHRKHSDYYAYEFFVVQS
jgi:SAM-dependent methyltransferase